MERFSDRIRVTPPRPIQIGTMDNDLRVALWNWLCWALDRENTSHPQHRLEYWGNATRGGAWDKILKRPVDEIPSYESHVQEAIKKWFMRCEWFDAYNLVQFVLPRVNTFRDQYNKRTGAEAQLNYYLEREMSGYRAINGHLVPVTSATELEEIKRATIRRAGFEGVARHIDTALALMSMKPQPDYRNSVKESISAVEAAAKLLTGEDSGGIDKALAILDSAHHLHPAFKSALSKLYAYTSDKDGIRHAILEEAHVSAAEARFMLVACSAFANFLIEVGRPANI